MGEEKIYFNGLRTERERMIFLDAFILGLSADDRIKRQIRRDMGGYSDPTAIRRAIEQSS